MKPELESDFELNIASIVDCLTVLITYLLASATFLSLGMLSVSLPGFSDEIAAGQQPELTVTIQLKDQGVITVLAEGVEKLSQQIPPQGGQSDRRDFQELSRYLKSLKSKNPNLSGIVVSAKDQIHYSEVIKAVETARQVTPQVAVSTEDL